MRRRFVISGVLLGCVLFFASSGGASPKATQRSECAGAPDRSQSKQWKDYDEIRGFNEHKYAFQYAEKHFGAPTSCVWRASPDGRVRSLSFQFPGRFTVTRDESLSHIESTLVRLDVDDLTETDGFSALKTLVKSEDEFDDDYPGKMDWEHPIRGSGVVRYDIDLGNESAFLIMTNGKVTALAYQKIEFLYD
jgi:hypothetical protein